MTRASGGSNNIYYLNPQKHVSYFYIMNNLCYDTCSQMGGHNILGEGSIMYWRGGGGGGGGKDPTWFLKAFRRATLIIEL